MEEIQLTTQHLWNPRIFYGVSNPPYQLVSLPDFKQLNQEVKAVDVSQLSDVLIESLGGI